MDIEEAETTASDDRCKKSTSGEHGSVRDGKMKTSSETPNEQGDVSNATEMLPMSDQASAMNAEVELVQDDRASQIDTFGLAKRAKKMLPCTSFTTFHRGQVATLRAPVAQSDWGQGEVFA
ncbi:hypothetical protein V5799_018643 [Amblyomma americanum]|uniref:Uncharacterized protein n=1 Tax=Amblyomma americanum TaxID=6943 RepID=A0AAQ4EYV0_AMBAM